MKNNTIKLHIFILCLLGLSLSGGIAVASDRTVSTDEIIRLTNQERRNVGLPELAQNPLLEAAAGKKAQDMIGNNYFAHTSPAGIDPWHWFEEVDYQYKYAGENLAMDFTSAVSVNRAWMKSPSHRDNILSEKFTEIGVAVIDGIIEDKETLVAVQLFGMPLGSNKNSAAVTTEPVPTLGVKVEEASMYPWKGNQEDELLVYAKVSGDPEKVEAIIGEQSYELPKHRENTYMNLFLVSEIQPETAAVVIKATINDEKFVFHELSKENIVTAANDNQDNDASVMSAANGNQGSGMIKQFWAQNGLLSVSMIFFIVILANIWVLEKEEERIILHAQVS